VIEQLESFVAVVDAGSFSIAGRRLGVPKSTISQRIRQLEQRLDARLLHRSTRSVRPTDTGRAYYERCIRILADIAEAELIARDEQKALSGNLRIHLPVELGMQVLGPLIASFEVDNPALRIELELNSRHIDLVEEGYDIAIRIGTLPNSSLVSRRILSIPRGLYASADYLAKRGGPLTPDDLNSHDCLRFHTAYHVGDWIFRTGRDSIRIKPIGRMVSNNLTVLRDAAVAGAGIALLPHFLCRAEKRESKLLCLLPDWEVEDAEVFVLYPSRHHLSGKVRGFLSFLDRNLKALNGMVG